MGSVVHVEVAWDTDPLTRPAEEDWTRLGTVDADLLVESLKTARGADIRTGAVEAGSATAVINDPNGNLDPSNGRSAWGQRVVTDGVTTNTDATVTSASAVFSEFDVGKAITGSGIPALTTIASVTSATEIELSANATATATGVSLTIGSDPAFLRRRVRFVVDPEPDVLTWDGDILAWGGDALAWGAAESVLWTGFVRSLPIQWRRQVQWTTLSATGIIWLLSEIALPPSVLHVETLSSTPAAYWPLTEAVGRIAEDVVGTRDGTYRRPVTASSALVPFDPRPCPEFKRPDASDSTGQAVTAPVTVGSDLTISLWWQCPTPPDGVVFPSVAILSVDSSGLLNTGGRILVSVVEQGGTHPDGDGVRVDIQPASAVSVIANVAYPGGAMFTGAPRHIVVSMTDGGDLAIYVDGVIVDLSAIEFCDQYATDPSTYPALFADITTLHMGWGITQNTGSPITNANCGHYAIWDRVLTAAEVATLHEAGVNPWADDLTGTRLNRILDLGGVDAGDRDIDAGTQTCGPTILAGQNFMEYVRKIAATEGGPFYEDAIGRVAFRERTANSPTIVATFSDDPTGDAGYPVSPLDPDYSTDRLINYAEVTRENGVAQTAEDAASRTKYGDKTVSLDTLHSNPSYARSTAARLTIRNNEPRLVFRQVEADAIDVANSVQLETDIGDAVDVIARPPRGGDPIDQTSIVERVEQSLEGHRWLTTFGVVEHIVLPTAKWDTAGRGWDRSVVP